MEKIIKLCPNCENEVEINKDFVKQVCPICKELVYPCSMCCPDTADCVRCPLDD
jgi:predicted RNA-binding Zn-ribbon protein involved in translation (DUF1610 family)